VAITPMLRQYQELKSQYPDVLLLFRLGDFYEMFFADAERGARLLQIALTSRQGAPMAGIPHHAAETYIARLVRAGQKIAVCEQMEAPAKGKKLVRREVVRVVTPGTITDTQFLDGAANNFLLALHRTPGALGAALVDVSTGDFWVGEQDGAGAALLEAALLRRPAELLVARDADGQWRGQGEALGVAVTPVRGWFAPRPPERLVARFGPTALDAFGGTMSAGLQAAGARSRISPIRRESLRTSAIQRLVPGDAMPLDPTAVATSACSRPRPSGRRGLVGAIDRRARPWARASCASGSCAAPRPRGDPPATGCIGVLAPNPAARDGPGRRLRGVGDPSPTSRAALGQPMRETVALRGYLAALPELKEDLSSTAPSAEPAQDITAPPALPSCWTRRWRTSRRSPCARAASSARDGTRSCATSSARPARRGTGSPPSSGASASGRGSGASASDSTACSGMRSRSATRMPRRCPPTISGARHWSAPSAMSRRS
jgi:DNA mismatch repair protein MutS